MRRTVRSFSRIIMIPVILLFMMGSFSGITQVRGEESTATPPSGNTDSTVVTEPASEFPTSEATNPSGSPQTSTDTTSTAPPAEQMTILLTGQVLDERSIGLDWDAIPDTVNYQISRDGTLLGNSNVNHFVDSTAEPNQIYQYTVEAFGEIVFNLGTGTATIKSKDTIPPNPPDELKETIVDADIIKIDWKNDPDAATYNIYRKEVINNGMGETTTDLTEGTTPNIVYSEEVQLGTAGSNSFTDETAAPNQTYVYKIEALDASGNVSQPTSVNVLSKDTAPPTAPANLRLKMAAANQNHLRWDEATDNRGMKGYNVYRSINGTSFDAIAITDSPHYIDAMITTGDEYQYKITAVDTSENESNFGNIETVKMPDDRSSIVFDELPLEDF